MKILTLLFLVSVSLPTFCLGQSNSSIEEPILKTDENSFVDPILTAEEVSSLPFVSDGTCVLDNAKDGDQVKIDAELYPIPWVIISDTCPVTEHEIVLIYGDDKSLGRSQLPVRKDDTFWKFVRLSKEELPDTPNEVCLHCAKYRITATFEGELQKARSVGLRRDPNTGEIIGWDGFAYGIHLARYRLILTGISNLRAVERPRNDSPNAK